MLSVLLEVNNIHGGSSIVSPVELFCSWASSTR